MKKKLMLRFIYNGHKEVKLRKVPDVENISILGIFSTYFWRED